MHVREVRKGREDEEEKSDIATVNFQGLSGKAVWLSLDRRPRSSRTKTEWRKEVTLRAQAAWPYHRCRGQVPTAGLVPGGPSVLSSRFAGLTAPSTANPATCSSRTSTDIVRVRCPWRATADSVFCSRGRIRYAINYVISVLIRLLRIEICRNITPGINLEQN